METREDSIFNRISFRFDSDFVAGDTFAPNSVIDVMFPTASPIETSDFDGLPLYWGLGWDGTSFFAGPIAGQVDAVPEPSSVSLQIIGAMGLILRRRRG